MDAGIIVRAIIPELKISGSEQQLVFGSGDSPVPIGLLTLQNNFMPGVGLPSKTILNFRNRALSGFRYIQETSTTDTYGTFTLNRYLNNDLAGQDLMIFDADGNVSFSGGISLDDVTINSDLDLTNHKLLNVASGVNPADGANIQNITNAIAAINVTFGGAVTGTGNVGSTITTTLTPITVSQISNYVSATTAFRLDQFAAPTADINMNNQKLINSAGLNLPSLGIGVNPTVNGRIQYANTLMDNKLSLYNTSGNDFNQSGFGYSALGTLYHAPLGLSHTFYLGNNTTIPLRVNPLGITISEGKVINTDFRRIMLYEEVENQHQIYNIGIKDLGSSNYAIHSQVSKATAAFTWAYGINSSSSYQLMSLSNSGLQLSANISITDPTALNPWNLNANADGSFSVAPSATTFNRMQLTSATTSGTDSIFNLINSQAAGANTSRIQLNFKNSTNGGYRYLATSAVGDPGGAGTLKLQGVSNVGVAQDFFAASISGGGTTILTSSSDTIIDGRDFTIKSGATNLLQLVNSTGNLGLSYPTLPLPARLAISGGVQNVASEESALRVIGALNSIKIELQNTAAGGKNYEIGSNNAGALFIRTNLITPYTIDANSNHIFNTIGTVFAKTPRGHLYISGNATGGATVANTWTKIPGTTTLGAASNLFDMSANNRTRYIGTPTLVNANIVVALTFTYATSVATRLGFAVFKNNVLIADSPKYVTNTATNLSMSVSLVTSTTFSTNDYIEIFSISPNGGVTLTATDLSITIQ